tara:strand:- start:221 stop:1258 length:1038 start_codon:yes stop_codon:yes gene_type:complete
MSRNTYSNPKLYIEDFLVTSCNDSTLSFTGKNALNKFTATLTNPDIDESSLFGKKITYYLNYGSEDSVPIFRGYITSVSSSDTTTKITGVDVRGYLTVDYRKIILSDKNNYDGYTLGQFLKYYINKFINTDKTFIGTDKINDTQPAVSLSKQRGTFKVYDLVKSNLSKALDMDDDNEPLDYSIDVVNDIDDSHIVFIKKKSTKDTTSMSFSRRNGIMKLSYKERPKKFVASLEDRDYVYGSNPSGPFNIEVQQEEDTYPEELREKARRKILKELNNNIDITIEASKGHYLSVGSLIYLNVSEKILSGPQRVTSKKISVKKNGVTLNFSLNREPIELSDYLPIVTT